MQRFYQKYLIIIILIAQTSFLYAQIGGESTYRFLDLSTSARVAALGGFQIAINDDNDLNLPFHNPASLSSEMDNKILFNYVNYLKDINLGYVSYAKSYDYIGNFGVGVHYINYGSFDEADITGQLSGNTFTAAEYAFNLFYSNNYKKLKYGVSIKPIYSVLEKYNSFGIAADFGVTFTSDNNLLHYALVLSNVGTQLSTYYDDAENESLPLNLQFGVSKKFKHAPITLLLSLHHLNNWKLANNHDSNKEDDLLDKVTKRDENFGKQFIRHTVFGVEVYPIKNFILRAGYNYQRRDELSFEENRSTVGFSTGFGVKIKRFQLDFGIAHYHIAGTSTLFSVGIDLGDNF